MQGCLHDSSSPIGCIGGSNNLLPQLSGLLPCLRQNKHTVFCGKSVCSSPQVNTPILWLPVRKTQREGQGSVKRQVEGVRSLVPGGGKVLNRHFLGRNLPKKMQKNSGQSAKRKKLTFGGGSQVPPPQGVRLDLPSQLLLLMGHQGFTQGVSPGCSPPCQGSIPLHTIQFNSIQFMITFTPPKWPPFGQPWTPKWLMQGGDHWIGGACPVPHAPARTRVQLRGLGLENRCWLTPDRGVNPGLKSLAEVYLWTESFAKSCQTIG